MGLYDDILGAGQSDGGTYDDIIGEAKQKKQNKGLIADIGTDLKRGVQQIPGAITGLADIAVGGISGKPLISNLADSAGEVTGFQPAKWAKSAEAEYSPSRQAGRAEVDAAWENGTASDIAGAYLKNPMNIVGSVAESLPSMIAGGLAGRAALGIGAKAVSSGAGGVGPALPGIIARTVGTGLAPAVGAGIGEGGIMAGQAMANSLDAGVDPRTAAGYAGATGLVGGALGALGGKVAQKFGVVDPETLIAGGIGRQGSNATGLAAAKEVGKRMAGGAISEGLFEELPQSVFEQGFQNLAQDKPLTEGMARAGVEGALAGSFMGGAFNAIPGGRYADNKSNPNAAPQDTPTVPPDVSLIADPVPVQQRIDAMLGLDTARMDDKGRALYEKDLAAAFNEPIGIRLDANQNEVPYTMGEYLDSQIKIADNERAKPLRSSANQQATTRLNQLAEEEAQQHAAITQDLVRSAAQGGALSKAALTGIQTGATQMPLHPERAAIEQQMLADEAAQAELAPIERLMRTRSDEQVQRIAENENANPKMRQVAIADLQRRMATKAQPTTTSPLPQTATQFNLPENSRAAQPVQMAQAPQETNAPQDGIEQGTAPQARIKQLQAQLKTAKPFERIESDLNGQLISLVTKDAEQAIASGVPPTYSTGNGNFVVIHPSAQKEGMIQVTRYTDNGVFGDSQYKSIEEAVRDNTLWIKERIASNDAVAVIEKSIQAEVEYQQRKSAAPVPNADAGIGVGGKSGIAKGASGIAQRQANAANNFIDSVQEQFGLSKEDAGKAWDNFVQNKLVKIDAVGGQYSLTDGRLWDGDVMRRAAAPATPEAQKAANREKLAKAKSKKLKASGNIINDLKVLGVDPNMISRITDNGISATESVNDLGEVAERLRSSEFGYIFDDVNNDAAQGLVEFLRRVASGDASPLNATRMEEDIAEREEYMHKKGVNERATELGLKKIGGKRTLQIVEAEIAAKEQEIAELEAREERAAIQASVIAEDIYKEGSELTEADLMQWLGDQIEYSQDEINEANSRSSEIESRRAQANAGYDTEAQAQASGTEGRGTGTPEVGARQPEGFDLAGQTNAEAAEAERKRLAAEAEESRLAAQDAADKKAAEKKSLEDAIRERAANPDNFQFGEDAKAAAKPMGSLFDQPTPAPVERKVTTEDARGQKDVFAQQEARPERDATNGQKAQEQTQTEQTSVQIQGIDAQSAPVQQAAPVPVSDGVGDVNAAPENKEGDWLEELFNQFPDALPEAPKPAFSDSEIASVRRQIDATISTLEASRAEWVAKVYKRNRTQVELHGDGPSNRASLSVGSINEKKRERAIAQIDGDIRGLKRFSQQLDSDPIKAIESVGKAITVSESQGFIDYWSGLRDSKGNQVTLSADERAQMNIANEILGDKYYGRTPAAVAILSAYREATASAQPVKATTEAKAVEPAAQSAEQKIRSAFDALPSVSLGVAYPITVEHNGVKREFMVRQDAIGRGKIPALHVVAIHQGRMISSDEKSWIAQSYKLNWKNELTEEGLPKKISDQEADEFKANFKGKPAAVDAKKEAETDDGIRYSKVSDAPAGEELVAIQNLTSENVLHAAAIGGIPVPSIGITKLSSPFTDFGEITLIADKVMIDPENSVPVFDRDAYTARFPEFNYKKVTAKKADAFYERMNVARELGDDGQSFISQLWDAVKNSRVQSPKKVADLFRTYLAPRMLYAKEVLGKEIKAPMIPVKSRVFFGHEKSWIDFVKANEELRKSDEDAYNKAASKAIKKAVDDFVNRSSDDEIRGAVRSAYKADIDRYVGDDWVNGNYLDWAIQDAKSVGTKRVDAVALSNRVAKIVPQDDPGYLKWVSNEISDLFVAPTITLRGKEVEASLDNIVDAMTIGKTNGAEKTMTFGVGKTSAMLGKRFKSIKEIQDHRNQVVSSSRESDMKKDSEKLLEEYRLKAVEHFTHTDWKGHIDTFAGFDAAMEALSKAGKGALTDGNIASAMRSVGFKNVPSDVINLARQGIVSIREAATDYFEAKPQRAVKLNEFNGAVVPNGTDQEVIDALKASGITDIRTYKRGDAEGRKKSVAFLAKKIHAQNKNTLFSNSAKSATQSEPLPRQQAERLIKSILGDKLGKVMIESGQVMLVDTEQGLKNLPGAKYMVAWHGSPHDHNKFDSSKIGTGEGAQAYGYGLYFAGARSVAEYYRNALSKSVNIEVRGKGALAPSEFKTLIKSPMSKANLDKFAATVFTEFRGYTGDAERDASSLIAAARNWYGASSFPLSVEDQLFDYAQELSGSDVTDRKGRLYQVELAPSENEFLDWDKTYSEQSEFVKSALGRPNEWLKLVQAKGNRPLNGMGIYKSLADSLIEKAHVGKSGEYVSLPSDFNEEKEASDYLHSIGIRGIRYLDGSSRSAGEGNHNYVIFSDDDVTITAKYAKQNGGIQGATLPDGRIALVLENLTKDNFAGVFQHEGFHSTIKDLVGQETYAKLMKQLENMHAIGKGAQWVKDANAAIPSDTKAENRTEELAAYAIEQYVNSAKQPNIITRWVESLLSALRTAIIRKLPFGKLKSWAINNLQPQDLANLAIAGLKAKARGQLQAHGRESMAFSIALPKKAGIDVFDKEERDLQRKHRAGQLKQDEWVSGMTEATDRFINEVSERFGNREIALRIFRNFGIAPGNENSFVKLRDYKLVWKTAIEAGPEVGNWNSMLNGFASSVSVEDAARYITGKPYQKTTIQIAKNFLSAIAETMKYSTNKAIVGNQSQDIKAISYSKINQTDTPAFKKWFGDWDHPKAFTSKFPADKTPPSMAMDWDNNRPLVLFHATNGDFNVFETGRESITSTTFGPIETRRHAIFTTPDNKFAESYLKKGGGQNVMPVYMDIKAPIDLRNNGAWDYVDELAKNGFENTRWPNRSDTEMWEMFDDETGQAFVAAAKKAGYDGAIMFEVDDNDKMVEVYVAFDPTQIKSAIGNNGDFSTNPDIRYSRAQIIGDSGRQYDQTQRQFFKNVGRDIDKKNLVERTTEYLKNDFWKKMAVGIVDQFRGLRDLGDNGQAYMLARLSKGTAGAFDALLHHGKLSIRDGVYDADTSGGFIDRLGTPLHGELDDFLWYVAANRAEGLSKVDRENLFTPADIAAGKSLAKGQTNFDYTIQTGPQKGTTTRNRALIYADANRVFNEFQKNALDMAEQSGLIDGASRKLWESEFYVPFYRVSEEDGEFIGAKMGNALVRQQAFKKLKGGTDKLNSDLLSNTLLNFSHLIEASAKNRAAKASLAAAEKIGAADRVAPDMASYAASNGAMLPPGTKGTVWFQENGKKVEYKVTDPFVMTAITSLEYAGMRNGVMDVMTKFKHWLTIGVTASPAFKVRNLIRDSIQSIGASDLSYNPIKNIAEGYKQTKRDSQEYVSALASGGLIRFGTMLEGSESSRVRQLVKSGVKDSTILNSENKWRAFYDQYLDPAVSAYNELGNRSEEINRAALYNQLIKQGKSHAEAALLARDLMDFSMQGSFNTIRFLTQVVPFMNARLQGMYKLGRAAKDNPRKLAVVTGAVAMASIALMLAYGDDDDWKRREDWDRDGFWWFKLGGIEFRIPKPFEVGAIGSLAERGLELMIDDEMTGERFRRVVSSLVMNNLSMNPIPQAFKPILDLYANKDSFTGRPIESMGMQRLDPTERFNSNTSMIARGMSNASFGALSPVQIDHLARAYFGWLGSFVIGGADMAFRGMSDQPTKPALDYFKFGTQGILKEAGTGSSRYVTQVYEQAKELEQAHATYRQMIKDGRIDEAKDYAEDNKDQMIRYRQVEAVKKVESNLNERIRKIERSDMDSAEKKDAIALINKQKEQVAKRITAGAS